ncbi:epidermal growth factor receptor-like isoform X2 [Dendropsophus ebraccatus]|uniref:epidermal growth factor receptor-like isoform X2 n=1 Tax=Dendropsophus ebraccatus TaxID=150705 RepID=UPI003831018C
MKAFGLDLELRAFFVFLLTLLLFITESCNAKVDKKVCLGTNYKIVKLGTTEEHYVQVKEMYNGCEIVLGNLEITHLQPHHDTSFLKEIQEVEGYVLIAGNLVKTIPLVNLRIIRGRSLFKKSALYISSNFDENNVDHGLEELPMRHLKEIVQGGVTITRNHRLCNVDTIKWKDIVHSGNDIDIKQSSPSHCPTCVENCNGSCWGAGPENCQIFTKLVCAHQCSGRCMGPNPSDCCHSQCAAGCTGPKETDCLACLKFRDGDSCLESCSETNPYKLRENLLEAGPEKYSFGSSCVKTCPYNYVVSDSGSCIHSCEYGTHEMEDNIPNYILQENDRKSDWTESEQLSINDVLKHNTYIITTGKETYNLTSKLEIPKVEVKKAIHDKKVCAGTINQLSRMGPVESHYNYLKKMYQGCEIVLGNLEITHLPANSDLSFLKDIQEVGGYVLIALNAVKSIPLVNLRIIRGEILLRNSSLSIFSNYQENVSDALEEVSMRQLQGSECDKTCNGSCWSNGPENCQILSKLVCDQTCSGRCRGPKPSDCCDHKCAAGCTGPKETDCLACKLVRDNYDKCLELCPNLHTFNDVHPLENNIKDSCVIKCPVNYMVTDCGTCVQKCSPGSYMVEEYGVLRCKKCNGPCIQGKICNGIGYGNLKYASAVNASNIDDFENCTIVLGSIVIFKSSIMGDRYTNTSAMDPAKLNILKSIREITGYLLIQWWPENYTDLSIFENVEVIRGGPKFDWTYALAVVNVSISSLGLKSLKEVSNGDVIIRSTDLCYADTINWSRIFRTNKQKVKTENKSLKDCVAEGKICDVSCSDDGCWGPGPSQCFYIGENNVS